MSARIDPGDGRKRQGKRDEQIRRKLETEIAKRKTKATIVKLAAMDYKVASAASEGSVLALKPLPPLTMPHDTAVMDAAQYMTAYRSSCVLVLDSDNAVCGIFTAKDLAFKIVAASAESGRDLRRGLTVSDIMTPHPMCVSIDSSAIEALNIMVTRGFRHLPIMDNHGEIAGVLDITKCFFEAMRKLERACESSKKLRDALEGMNTEFGSSMHPQQSKLLNYVEALKEHTSGPDLGTVFDTSKPPISIDVGATVAEAAVLMKQNKTTAILVLDKDVIAGIFTTKDIVLRVLAANIEPQRCSVIRVMTPNPECAPTTMNIQTALRKMHTGKYLNLPVKNEDGNVLGIIDVLRLTYATLEHLNGMTRADGNPSKEEGPAWNKFWISLDTDTESDGPSRVYPHGFEDLETDSKTNVSDLEMAQFNVPDSASDVGSDSFYGADSKAAQTATLATTGSEELRPEDSLSRLGISEPLALAEAAALDAAQLKASFSFKFKAPSGRAHRVQVLDDTDVETLRTLIAAKLSEADISTLGGIDKFAVSYLDDDRDVISITTKDDISDAMESAKKTGSKRTEIYLHHADQTPSIRPVAKTTMVDGQENGVVPMLVGSAAAVMFGLLAWGRK